MLQSSWLMHRKKYQMPRMKKEKLIKIKKEICTKFYDEIWRRTGKLRKTFPGTQAGYLKSKANLADKVKLCSPSEYDLDDLKRMYDSAYSSTAQSYPRILIQLAILLCLTALKAAKFYLLQLSIPQIPNLQNFGRKSRLPNGCVKAILHIMAKPMGNVLFVHSLCLQNLKNS
jgi:hypothetical protein